MSLQHGQNAGTRKREMLEPEACRHGPEQVSNDVHAPEVIRSLPAIPFPSKEGGHLCIVDDLWANEL